MVSASHVWELSDKSGSESTVLTVSAALLTVLPLSVWTLKTAGWAVLRLFSDFWAANVGYLLQNVQKVKVQAAFFCLQCLCEFVIVSLTVLGRKAIFQQCLTLACKPFPLLFFSPNSSCSTIGHVIAIWELMVTNPVTVYFLSLLCVLLADRGLQKYELVVEMILPEQTAMPN